MLRHRSTRRLALLGAALCAPVPAAPAQDGLTLYQTFNGTTTFLIDSVGSVVNSWSGTVSAGEAYYLMPDGDLMRTRTLTSGGGGVGGGFERLSYDGTVEWQFAFFDETYTPHHDIEVLPDGNLLCIAWEEIGEDGAIALGRDPSTVSLSFMPDAIFELEPVGNKLANVVWEWHARDHLVQDFDASKPNFGVIADHPERIDVNWGLGGDWMHTNAIDYNPELDQIALCVPTFDEIWIIDHSTTTAEAAGSTGGTSGKGGDLLYRWGNPQTYDRGTEADRVFYIIHDVQWIEPGRPGAGNLLIYNNGQNRPTGDWSSVDEWVPPVDASGHYELLPGEAYGPAALAWTYADPGNFYSGIISGAERLRSGNTLITEGTPGRLFEVDPLGNIVWTYQVSGFLPWVFKARRYDDCDLDGVYDGHEIAQGALDGNGNNRLDECEAPENYCEASVNTTGSAASMSWSGSTSLAANDLLLGAGPCPPGVPGLFAFSANQGSTPLGEGTLCIAGPISRLGVAFVDGAGQASFAFDNQDLPGTAPPLVPGTEWNFTYWFRDVMGGPEGSNLADGLRVVFLP